MGRNPLPPPHLTPLWNFDTRVRRGARIIIHGKIRTYIQATFQEIIDCHSIHVFYDFIFAVDCRYDMGSRSVSDPNIPDVSVFLTGLV